MILNLCIGCGCDEAHACEHAGEPCKWLRFRAETRSGVCSACEDLVGHWDRGHHALLPQMVLERFHRQVMFLYGEEASAKAWVNAPHPQLGGRTPASYLLEGRLDPVYAILDQLRDGAYA